VPVQAAAGIAALQAVQPRCWPALRFEQVIQSRESAAADQGEGAFQGGRDPGQKSPEFEVDADRIRRGRDVEQRTVDVEEQAPPVMVIAVVWGGAGRMTFGDGRQGFLQAVMPELMS
jgi:hypothetical protein